jgi:LmbE family N-acetylglucosaminyl deacetylase
VRALELAKPGEDLAVLCLGAHSDDIEIGGGGTILGWVAAGVRLKVNWCVLSATGRRAAEAETSAASFLAGAASANIEIMQFKDGFFPCQSGDIKAWMEALKARTQPDIILTHRRDDAHQDHREVSGLTWNTFRDHLIMEYEVPKWDGYLGQPNFYVPLAKEILQRKVDLLLGVFGTQRSRDWFDPEVFRGLARLRGMECRAPENYAEGFWLRKARLN